MILTEEQLLIQETARKFAQERLAPNSAQWERDCAFPRGLFRELGELGFMGMTVPDRMGRGGRRQCRLLPWRCRRSRPATARWPPS